MGEHLTPTAFAAWIDRAEAAEAVLARARAILTDISEAIDHMRSNIDGRRAYPLERALVALADVLATDEPDDEMPPVKVTQIDPAWVGRGKPRQVGWMMRGQFSHQWSAGWLPVFVFDQEDTP